MEHEYKVASRALREIRQKAETNELGRTFILQGSAGRQALILAELVLAHLAEADRHFNEAK